MMKSTVVIKLGGSSLQSSETVKQLAVLIHGYQQRCCQVVLVHGGGPAINAELTRRNIIWQFINGQRQTTSEMMAVIIEVLAKEVNGMLVENLKQAGISAVGLSGAEAEILFCSQAATELMCVGKIEKVNTSRIIETLCQGSGGVPVIAPIGYDANGESFNINADWAASQIAAALGAEQLIFLTDQDGILDQQKKLVPLADLYLIEQMIADGTITGGMFTKVNAMLTAMSAGVKQVRVLNASIAGKALTSEASGTTLINAQSNKEVIYERAL